jgi:tRNA threonylcarbamoyladenosine biosynthesis protein TsaB
VLVLALDASTYDGSVAVIRAGALVGERTTGMRGEREERLMPAVSGVLRDAGVDVAELTAVACGAGPGSFTSLRIAASIAKGIAVGLEIPLLAAPSPLLVVAGASPPLSEGRYLVLMDAMRGDVFAQFARVDAAGAVAGEGPTWLAPRAEALRRARSEGGTVVGPVETPARPPHARGFARLLANGAARPVDVSTWEPDYGRKAEAQVRWEQAHGRALEVS